MCAVLTLAIPVFVFSEWSSRSFKWRSGRGVSSCLLSVCISLLSSIQECCACCCCICSLAHATRVMSPSHTMQPTQRHFRSSRLIVTFVLAQFHDCPGAHSECIRFAVAFANPSLGYFARERSPELSLLPFCFIVHGCPKQLSARG